MIAGYNNKTSGFSLIELMVVIAIVAVLAAIALPAYRSYVVSSKVMSVIPVLTGLMDQSIEYAHAHGRFGNGYDLGLSATPSPSGFWSTVDNPKALHPYLLDSPDQFIIGDSGLITNANGGPCGGSGQFDAYIDPVAIGYGTSDAWIELFCAYGHVDGVIKKLCAYVYSDPTGANAQTSDLKLGNTWLNDCDTITCNSDTAAYTAALNNLFSNASCQ